MPIDRKIISVMPEAEEKNVQLLMMNYFMTNMEFDEAHIIDVIHTQRLMAVNTDKDTTHVPIQVIYNGYD